eukprot:3275003-Pleurochrysis_carterae.AAC.1
MELGISDADYLRLHFAMCKEYKASQWQRRLWYHDKVTGIKLYLPEHLVPCWRWLQAWRNYG